MNNQLEPLKIILKDFISQMKQKEEIWKSLGKNIAGTSGFGDEDIDPWPRKEAYCWIFADLYDHFPKIDRTPPIVEAAKELAKPYYDTWLECELDIQDYKSRIIKEPTLDETLEDYLDKISSFIRSKKYRRSSEIRSLRSFTANLREELPQTERGLIEEYFPEVMKLVNGKIIKVNPPTVYPIDIFTTAEILKRLVTEVLDGRPSAQFCAAETLGLCLACLTCARRRLPTQLKLVARMPMNCLILPGSFEKADKKNQPLLKVPTFYGSSPMPISLTMANYFDAIKNIIPKNRTTLFQSNPRCLRRTLDGVVKNIPSTTHFGKITFLTFLSFPHEAIGQR